MITSAQRVRRQLVFQPFDGRQVEMVGRLVEQEDVGGGRQHPRDRRAPRFAAREVLRILAAVEAELFHEIVRRVRIVAGPEPGFHIGERRRKAGEVRLLRQVAHGGAGLHKACAAVGLDQSGGDLEQRRLARAVAADQTDALAGRDRQLDAVEQRRAAERERDVLELYERRRHAWVSRLRRLYPSRRGGLQAAGIGGPPGGIRAAHCAMPYAVVDRGRLRESARPRRFAGGAQRDRRNALTLIAHLHATRRSGRIGHRLAQALFSDRAM